MMMKREKYSSTFLLAHNDSLLSIRVCGSLFCPLMPFMVLSEDENRGGHENQAGVGGVDIYSVCFPDEAQTGASPLGGSQAFPGHPLLGALKGRGGALL